MTTQQLIEADPVYLSEMAQLVQGEHWDPHHFLGLHPHSNQAQVIRMYRPGAKEVYLQVLGATVQAHRVHDAGVFEYVSTHPLTYKDYKVYHQNGLCSEDPYAFHPTWGEIDSHLFNKGVHYKLYEHLGAHLTVHQDVAGVKFSVWAPSAMRVALVGDFNFWDGREQPHALYGELRGLGAICPGAERARTV